MTRSAQQHMSPLALEPGAARYPEAAEEFSPGWGLSEDKRLTPADVAQPRAPGGSEGTDKPE